jgi:hypothetical protein
MNTTNGSTPIGEPAQAGAETRARARDKSDIDLDTRILNDNVIAAVNASERLHMLARKKLQALGLDSGGVVGGNGLKPAGGNEVLTEAHLPAVAEGLMNFLGPILKDIEKRIAELEQQAVKYRGIWNEEETYSAGTLITFQGGMWYAASASAGERPGSGSSAWTLANKSRR